MQITTPDMDVYAVMSNDAIGVSMGSGMREHLADFMDQDDDSDGVFMSLDYDIAAMAALQEGAMQNAGGHGDAWSQEMMAAYQAMMDRERAEFRFTDDGLEIEARDDGQGAEKLDQGNGLTGMAERLRALGGRLAIDTESGKGFHLDAWMPAESVL